MAIDPHIWIAGQIVVDVILVVLLLWSMRSHGKREMTWQGHEKIIQRAEDILSEMTRISEGLEANLKEKRELSRLILEQLDKGLKRAQDSYGQLSKIMPKPGGPSADPSHSQGTFNHTRASVHALLEKGLAREEVAQHLGISVAEIELLMKLRPAKVDGFAKSQNLAQRRKVEGFVRSPAE